MNRIETVLKQKLSNNWNHVRKAFLDLDNDQDGYVTAEDLAKFLKNAKIPSSDGSLSNANSINFTMLQLLIKLRCKQEDTNINYNHFCQWVGSTIEPIEAFYFRHDSNKNPSYEFSFKRQIEPNLKNTKNVR